MTGFAVRRWQLTMIIAALFGFLGLSALFSIPRAVDPHFDIPIVIVFVAQPGADALDLEQTIAKPIEQAIIQLDDVEEVGFATDDAGRYGASLDGRVGERLNVEIKCALAPTHVEYVLEADEGRMPARYRAQVMMQMLVSGAEACDFVAYHPHLPLGLVRVERDPLWIDALAEQIEACIAERDRALAVLERRGASALGMAA